MAYEGALLAASVVQAISAIPGAWRDLRDILSAPKPDANAALLKLDELRAAIVAFQDTAGWLEEAKRLHELLQNVDTTFEPLRAEYSRATAQGPFNFQAYNVPAARMSWQAARFHSFARLLAFTQEMKRIEPEPLRVEGGKFVSGPEWARRLLELQTRLEAAIITYDQGAADSIRDIAVTFDELNRHIKNQMHLADERIRKEAVEFAMAVVGLAQALKGA